jgi:hypothetical protein
MSAITQGASECVIIEKTQQPTTEERAHGEGTKLNTTYFEVQVTYAIPGDVEPQELSDDELLVAAEKAGTFEFLNAPEEDGYNDLLPPRE